MYLVGIAGGSGSGKTTFVKKVLARVGSNSGVSVLHLDSYYLAKIPEGLEIHGRPNFDHPIAFDWDLVAKHVGQLKNGQSIEAPVYDFKTSSRLDRTEAVVPGKVLLVEGIYTLWEQKLRGLFDLKIYLSVDADIRFIRRLHRDIKERGRTLDSVVQQYYDTVRPMHSEFLEPTHQFADLIVGQDTDVAAEVIAARLAQFASREQVASSKSEPENMEWKGAWN